MGGGSAFGVKNELCLAVFKKNSQFLCVVLVFGYGSVSKYLGERLFSRVEAIALAIAEARGGV